MEQSTQQTGLVAPTRWQRAALPSTGALLVAEAAAAVGALGTAAVGGAHWAAGAAALALGGSALARVRGGTAAEYIAGRLTMGGTANPRIEPAPYPGGGQIGVRRRAGLLTAHVRIAAAPPHLVALLQRDDPAVPLHLLAGLLDHADTPAARIDVLLAGGRSPGSTTAPRVRYLQLLGPVARWATSDVVVAVTVDPADCAAACARRGGGPAGELRVAALAAQRVVDALGAAGIGATPVRPAEAGTVGLAIPDDAIPADPDALARGDLDHLLRMCDSPSRAGITVRRDRDRGVRIGAWRSALSDGPRFPRRGDHEASGGVAALRSVHVPLVGCGQVLGADASGGPVAARLHGPGVRTVWAAVADDPARQLVERAVATGARVLLITGRPAMWEPLVTWVGSPEALWVSGWRYPDTVAALEPSDYTVTVLDGTASGLAPGSVEPSGTVWRVEQAGISPVTEADVVLSQPLPGMLTVRTDGGAATLRLVA